MYILTRFLSFNFHNVQLLLFSFLLFSSLEIIGVDLNIFFSIIKYIGSREDKIVARILLIIIIIYIDDVKLLKKNIREYLKKKEEIF